MTKIAFFYFLFEQTFRKRWKTPPRGSQSQQNVNSSPLSSYPNRTRFTPVKLHEAADGNVEKTPRRLFDAEVTTLISDKIDASIETFSDSLEFLPPPNRFHLLTSKKDLFSNYRERFSECFNDSLDDSVSSLHNSSLNESVMDTPGFKERNQKLADVEKGLEVVGRCLAKAQNVGWKEFWSFLDEFVDIASADGLTKFENYLQQKIDGKMKPPLSLPLHTERYTSTVESSLMSSICRGMNKFHVADSPQAKHQSQTAPGSPNAFHAYLCVEKSCQVFANRLLKPISQQSNNLVVVNDALACDLGRLKSLVCSYKEDSRFFAIDFRAVHSRIAHILVALLKESTDSNDNDHQYFEDVDKCLRQILLAKEKSLTSNTNNNNGPIDPTINVQQLICLIKFILKRFDTKTELISPETLTTERDCYDVWAAEEKCDCEWINQSVNNKINRNIKRRHENNQKLNEMEKNGVPINAAMEQDDDERYWVCVASNAECTKKTY